MGVVVPSRCSHRPDLSPDCFVVDGNMEPFKETQFLIDWKIIIRGEHVTCVSLVSSIAVVGL